MNRNALYPITLLWLTILWVGCNNDPEVPDPQDDFVPSNTTEFILIEDQFQNRNLLVIGSEALNMIVAFWDDTTTTFEVVQDDLPAIMKSADGTKWDAFGYAIEGPRQGQRLQPAQSLMGFWLAFPPFYLDVEIYEGEDPARFTANQSQNPEWLIPPGLVFDGGPGKDGIPALENPTMVNADQSSAAYLTGGDLVLAIKIDEEVWVYPHDILDWHEIVNDDRGGMSYAITYCPLTGTGIGWNRDVNGTNTTFGVSGLLYNTNLMPYDRATDSYWSQMRFDCVNGASLGTVVETITLLETNWATVSSMYPNALVVSQNTGINRDYGRYPYGSYKTNDNTIFPVDHTDDRMHIKERVLGVIMNGKAKVYRFSSFVL